MRLLEEFWYGNIEPTEYDTNVCKEYREVLRMITRNEEKLQAMKLHNLYSESKNCKFKELRETARQLYLDEKGIHKDFRW